LQRKYYSTKDIVSDYADFIVNPYIYDEALEVLEVSDQYKELVGARIRGLRFQSAAEASLSFDNGFRLKANNSDRHGGDIWRVNRRKRDSNT